MEVEVKEDEFVDDLEVMNCLFLLEEVKIKEMIWVN